MQVCAGMTETERAKETVGTEMETRRLQSCTQEEKRSVQLQIDALNSFN